MVFDFLLQDCPTGHYCPTTNVSPIPCENGFYSDDKKQTKCSLCPEGYRCSSGSDKPIACSPGDFSQAGNSTCSFCPGGYECINGEFIIVDVSNSLLVMTSC